MTRTGKVERRDDVVVLVPAWNEGQVIRSTVDKILESFDHVVVVDDGSTDDTKSHVLQTRAMLVCHPVNLGQGASLQTAVEFALQYPQYKYFVTFDADGQHGLEDAKRMLVILEREQLDIVMGSRFLGSAPNIPRTKKIMLRMAVVFTNVFSRVRLTDTNNGLRVFNRDFAERLKITMPGMAHASEIIDIVGSNGWKYQEVPVTIRYTDYSRAKGQSMLNSVNILLELLLKKVSK